MAADGLIFMACGLEVSADSVPSFTGRGVANVKEQRRQGDRYFAAPSQPAERWSHSAFGGPTKTTQAREF